MSSIALTDRLQKTFAGNGADTAVAEPPAAPAEVAQAPAATEEVKAEVPATPEVAAEATPAAPAEEAKAEEVPADPLEAYVKGGAPVETPLTDDTKAFLKTELGIEDHVAFKKQRAIEQEEVGVLKQAKARLDAIEQNLGKLPVELEEAITDYLAGKDADPVARIKGLGVSVTTPSKDVEPTALVDTYFKGKFSAEQMEELREGTAAPELKDVFDKYHELATGKHDERGAKQVARSQELQQQHKVGQERLEHSALASVAYLKEDKALAAMVDPKMIDDFVSGKLVQQMLFNPDGTYKPEALKRLVTPDIHDTLVKRMREGAFSNGKTEGEAKAHAERPQGPAGGNAKRVPPSQEKSPEQTVAEQVRQLTKRG